jgi:dimethylaniline monooxygenase (N-oxide forming)
MKVAIIGAGVSGLPSIKSCLEMGFEVVCFERRNDVGGLWNYSEITQKIDGAGFDVQGNVMYSTVTNVSKETMSYSDFLVPRDFPQFLPHNKFLEYLRMYADHFQLTRHIRFHTEVSHVKEVPVADRWNTGQWIVTSKDLVTGSTTSEYYDAIFICVGHENVKYMPDVEGQKDFKGRILHTHDYRLYAL